MRQENQFSLYEQVNPVNTSLSVTFTPNDKVTKYQYKIIHNDNVISTVDVNKNQVTTFDLTETGSYKIEIIVNEKSRVYHFDSGIYNIDKEKPILIVDTKNIDMPLGSTLDIMEGVKATDVQDGDISSKIITNYEQLDFTTTGLKRLEYYVSDTAGNTTTAVVNVNVITTNNSLIVFQMGIIFSLLLVGLFIILFRRSVRLERRIAKYAIEPLEDNSVSIYDNIFSVYSRVLNGVLSIIKKSVFLNKYAKRYDKYVNVVNKKNKSGLELVANKIIVALLFVVISIIFKTIHYEVLNIYEVVIPLIAGFFILDFVYMYKYRLYCNALENDLLQAIIIMNNAFKSGRSITQAIELVSNELEGSIAEEFKKMYLELTFGLSIDVVFKRFSERIKLDEITYLTASLTILNKTGGNIIKVFTSIEESLFNKKKLKLELASLTGSSKIIAYVLFIVPFLFALFIMLIDPTYFEALYTTVLGYILLGLIIIMYISYIFFISKIMKVRM